MELFFGCGIDPSAASCGAVVCFSGQAKPVGVTSRRRCFDNPGKASGALGGSVSLAHAALITQVKRLGLDEVASLIALIEEVSVSYVKDGRSNCNITTIHYHSTRNHQPAKHLQGASVQSSRAKEG